MKQPDIKNCPCCGHETTGPRPDGRKGVALFAAPKCQDVKEDADGNLQSFRLTWHCTICGCYWNDGQVMPATVMPPVAIPVPGFKLHENGGKVGKP